MEPEVMCALSDRLPIVCLCSILLFQHGHQWQCLPRPSPLSPFSYALHLLLFSSGMLCCSNLHSVELLEKPHFKQQTFPFLCYVPSHTSLYLDYLMPVCLLTTWVGPSPPVSWSKLVCHTFLSACNFRLHWSSFGLELNTISSKVQLKPTSRKSAKKHVVLLLQAGTSAFPRGLADGI